jgi:hypothetical protein
MEDKFKRRRISSPVQSLVEPAETLLEHTAGTSFKIPGVVVKDHIFRVPLDHSGELVGHTIEVFVRELVAPANEKRTHQPFLLFLQGVYNPRHSSTTAVQYVAVVAGGLTLQHPSDQPQYKPAEAAVTGSTLPAVATHVTTRLQGLCCVSQRNRCARHSCMRM